LQQGAQEASKDWGGGGPTSRATLGYRKHFRVSKRAPKKIFPEMLATEEGKKKFSRRSIPKLHVFDQIFKKNLEINKKGTFDVNLVFTATLACTKRALFITNKGTFHHKKVHF
jgi:hypothetical protein